METVKDVLNFCNDAVFYNYKNICILVELNQARKCIINNSHETILVSRILKTLCVIDVVLLKIHDNDIENVIKNINDLRDNIMYMLSFEKVSSEEQEIDETIS